MKPASVDDAVTASPLVVARKMATGAILMNTSSGDCFELNAVGASVWDLIGQRLGMEAIIDKVVRAYAVERSIARTDVLHLVDELARQGIVLVTKR